MAKTEHYYTVFEEGCFYHIYNRTINKQPMFKQPGNFEFFLKQYDKYLSPVVETYAYCLLPNHFHIMLHVKENAEAAPDQISPQPILLGNQRMNWSVTNLESFSSPMPWLLTNKKIGSGHYFKLPLKEY